MHNSKLKAKLIRNLGANAYGQVVTVTIQLASVPLYLHFWGVGLYGEWLVLTAIPAYLSLSDIGFASVAANEMTMRMARGDKQGTLEVYQSIWVFICCMSVVVGCALSLIITNVPLNDVLSISNISADDIQYTLIVMILYVLMGLQAGVLSAAFRAVGRYAFAAMSNNTVRLVEWLFSGVALVLGEGVLVIATTMLMVRFTGLTIMWAILLRQERWLSLGLKAASIQKISNLFKPAVAFMAFPLGLALSIQGMVLLVGATLGPTAVVVFSTYRTLTRLLVQVVTMINQAVWPEISAAYGTGKIALATSLHRKGAAAAFWVAIIAVSTLWLMGDRVIEIWTNNAIEQHSILLFLLLLVTFINVLWQTSWVVLMATNKHEGVSILFVLSTASGLFLSWLLIPVVGLNGVGIALIVAELPMLYVVINSALLLLGDSWVPYIRAVVVNPFNKSGIRDGF